MIQFRRKIGGFIAVALIAMLSACSPKTTDTPTYTNPILGGDYPDPTILRDGEDYYLTHSAFDYLPGLVVFHSRDLVNWEPISYALSTYLGSVWAPDISKVGDKYYIYFAVHNVGNFMVEADSPYGPWSEPVNVYKDHIDPALGVGDDGTKWLFLSSGVRVRLTEDGRSSVGELEKVYEGWEYPSDWVTEGFYLEGPKINKVGDWWYMVSAEGGTAGPPTSHMVVVARSRSIDGPWENSPYNPLVHTYSYTDRWWSRGHGDIVDTPDGRWYIVYHSYENGYYNLGRQTLLEPVELTDDGWFKPVEGLDVAGEIPMPLEECFVDRKSRLSEFRIGLDWKFYKEFNPERVSADKGVLTLKAQGHTPTDSSPIMFVSGDHAYEFEAEIEKSTEAIAGLVLYYNTDYYAGAGMDDKGIIRYQKGWPDHVVDLADRTHFWMRLRNDHHVVTAYYSLDGSEWTKLGWGQEISGLNHNVLDGFQGVLPGLFAAGEGEVRFSNFKYTKLD